MAFSNEVEAGFQKFQLGVESTYGTEVNADRHYGGIDAVLSPKVMSKSNKVKGQLLPSIKQMGRKWSEIALDGIVSYPEFADTTSNPVKGIVRSVVSDAQVATPIVYTAEIGGQTIPGCVVTDWSVDSTRDDMSFKASMKGKKALTQAGTNSISIIDPYPIPPANTTISISSAAALDTPVDYAKWIKWNISVSKIMDLVFFSGAEPSNCKQTSMDASFGVTFEADTNGLVPLGFDDGATHRVVVSNTSVANGYTYVLSFSFDVKFDEPESFSDEDGIYAIGYKADIVNKATTAIAVVCTKTVL